MTLPDSTVPPETASAELAAVRTLREAVVAEVQKAIVGQDDAIEAMLIALLAQGHLLLEGVPGTAKTLMVRALAGALGLRFGRIQFTPDLMPSDILGTHVFDLGPRANYLPSFRRATVEDTTVLEPLEIVFTRKADG